MRLKPSSLFISALCCSVGIANAAQVYTFDTESSPHNDEASTRILSPIEARLVLAQRAGVEDYHIDTLLKPGAISAINEFGVRGSLFRESGKERKRTLILVEVPQEDETQSSATPHFTIAPAPSINSTLSLFLDLTRQRYPSTYSTLSDADILSHHDQISGKNVFLSPNTNDEQEGFGIVRLPTTTAFQEFWQDLRALIHRRQVTENNKIPYSVTAIVVSTTRYADPNASSEGKFTWGTYSLPTHFQPQPLQSQRQKRQTPQPSSPISPLQDESTEPLRGILPACFPTLSTCQSLTRNCTGHGSCVLAYTDLSSSEPNSENCYQCQCVATVQRSRNGAGEELRSTTVWAGPACQKHDVSASFWLIVGLTVGIVSLISFAVGSLMEVGDATLPGVIGAGVSGVRARQRG